MTASRGTQADLLIIRALLGELVKHVDEAIASTDPDKRATLIRAVADANLHLSSQNLYNKIYFAVEAAGLPPIRTTHVRQTLEGLGYTQVRRTAGLFWEPPTNATPAT